MELKIRHSIGREHLIPLNDLIEMQLRSEIYPEEYTKGLVVKDLAEYKRWEDWGCVLVEETENSFLIKDFYTKRVLIEVKL